MLPGVWNAALEQRRLARQLRRPGVWGVVQMAELSELKRSEGFEWLGEDAIAQSLEQTLRDLDVAYRRYFAGLKLSEVRHQVDERSRARRRDRGVSRPLQSERAEPLEVLHPHSLLGTEALEPAHQPVAIEHPRAWARAILATLIIARVLGTDP